MSSATHTTSRIILATQRAIFRAFFDPEVLVNWRPPTGMSAELHAFDPRPGGGYRMTLAYEDPSSRPGKTAVGRDVVHARFLEIYPEERIVEAITFETDYPAFSGTMTLTTTMRPVTGGTKVTFLAENVPEGIAQEDHLKGMESTLKNLANLLE
ncbi:SRPBCC domain-containing protein [Sphingomonas sp. H39-1-10]|uniref:SRPBCC domain-containing protein n=1 Tax=Sphingomonadales TaxID=204457 RepID=UPI000C20C407|nr:MULTISPECIES: SRPBCC domain-containing protein [Sphingomonadaceae]MDF0490072.1 SRPBCC domain-containing protein [Sphingomonas pollutisoli]PJG45503.1 ATPase [Sphingobium sp. LB126]